MKKIGIITLNGNTNYGNRLQNYALKETLSQLNLDVSTIWFLNNRKFLLKEFIKKQIFWIPKYLRFSRFKKFSRQNLNIQYYLNKNIENEYDYFIAGSDQVWNWSIYKDFETLLLQFSPRDKNISYAASFGVDYIPDLYRDTYKRSLTNFRAISVREEVGAKLVRETAQLDAEVVLDPTMLLTKEDWDQVSKKPKQLKNQKYILNYFLGKLSEERKQEIERIAKENDCQIIHLLDPASPFFTCGPSEFLYLEKNAFLICTDSFHSSVFAILYDRPFLVFEREDKNANMNSRLETLLTKFHLESRKFNKEITPENLHHDYTSAYKILEKEREKSKHFLKKALDIE